MTDDTKALVDRLRYWRRASGSLTARDAADTIERLERELAEAHQIERSDGEVRRELDARLAEIEADRDALAERCEKLREALARIGDLCEFTLVRRDFVYGIGQIEGAVQEALTAHMNIASYAGGHGTTGAVDLNGLSQESAVGTAGILAAPKDAP